MKFTGFRFAAAYAFAALVLVGAAQAHPHVWVSVQTELLMNDKQVEAVRHHWTFDEAFSAFASQGLDEDGDGKLSREELQPLAQVNVESLSEFGFFSDLYEAGTPDNGEAIFGQPENYWLTVDGDQLTLHFTLPVVMNVNAAQEVVLDVYDPTYFVDFSFAERKPAKVVKGPRGCNISIKKPEELDDDTASLLAQIPADQRDIPEDLMQITSTMANQVILKCD